MLLLVILCQICYRYSQIKNYPFDTHELKPEHLMTNAFSAVVWDEVQFLGMGISHHNGTKESYVVARYSPRPNVGNYEDHVKPQLKHRGMYRALRETILTTRNQK